MAAPTYVGQGGASAVSAATAPAYPTGLASGDLLLLFVSSDSSGIGAAPAGWTSLGSVASGGGISVAVWSRPSDGTETGTQTIGVIGGTKGASWIAAYRPATSGHTLSATLATGADTDATSTAIAAAGPSWTVALDQRLVAMVCALAAGTFTASATGVSLTNPGATLATTARFAGRTGANALYYGHIDGSVTAGGTGAPTYTATAQGANATGMVAFVRITETASATTTPVTTSRSTSWAVRSTVTTTRATTFGIRAAVAATRSTSWAIVAPPTAVTTSRSATWAVGLSGATWDSSTVTWDSPTTTWDGQPVATTTVETTRSTTWRVFAEGAVDRDISLHGARLVPRWTATLHDDQPYSADLTDRWTGALVP